ncbi:hypothetical protein HU200_058423 [Digitaria exilis]|uniref:Uncharacterized protein n=1 Tax=Digitaria exilis TaxID=1010633 RepID=A0A835AN35_9POAL|nr:hypothetical protein HU200_058423 [Digitaria exilis]
MDCWPVYPFSEYVQGPRSVWPSDEEVRAYEAGQALWPCAKYPEKRRKPPLLEAHDTLVKYWRLNRILYPRPLSQAERVEKQRKLEERHLRGRKGALERSSDGVLEIRDGQREAVRPPGSVLRKEKDKRKSTSLRVRFGPVEPTLPQDTRGASAVNKGKRVVVISSDEEDGWGDDEVLSGCE